MSGFLSALSTTLSGYGTGTPAGPLNFLTAALSLVGREINRLTSSYAPAAQSVQTGQQLTAARTTASPTAAASVSSSPSANYAVSSDWGSGFTGNVTVAAGPSALNGWTVSFNTPAEITNIWNGVISSHVGTAYVVTNAPYNGQVSAGQTTSFGFQANTGAAGSAVTGLQVNGAAVVTPPVTPPGVSVAGVTAAEPASGTAQAAFTVSLSKASTTPVTIGYATTNGTATAGTDYTATTGTLTFAPGVTSQQINVPILADTAVESSETFTVTLSNPSGATITGATATGTITNTTTTTPITVTPPSVSVGNVTAAEPSATGTAQAAFTVTLSKASTTSVTIGYATTNGTATAGTDYTATTGTLTFAPGVTSQQISVPVLRDTVVETAETFTVTLSNPTGATITTATATGTITNTAPITTSTGTVYNVTATGADVIGFNAAKDKLDLGDVSVHNFIVVDTPEGVGFRSPWTGETAIIQGVSLGQLTVDNFNPIINDHLRQDLSGALAWERGVTAAPNTVYIRSHELGQVDSVAFNPATDVVDFRYYGTREQLYMSDSPNGLILGNAGTGQALILKGVTKSQLTATNFVFHFAQAREDSLYKQLGFTALPDSQIKPQGVPMAGTNIWPTAAGTGTPPAGKTGTTTVIAWKYGTNTALAFDPSKDKLDFGWFTAPNFDVTDSTGSTKITIVGNNQTYTLSGVTLSQLQTSNIIALDSGARTEWQNLIFNATPATPLPTLSVGDRSIAEGNTGTSAMNFTVLLSKAAANTVSVGYSTSTDTATAGDFTPTVGTLSFAPGETSKIVSVAIVGDTMYELNEQFTLNLSNASNATIADAAAIGIITNDDVDSSPSTAPKVSIADLAMTEGNGEHSHFMFTATLDKASATPVSVNYATSNGTATAGVDYTADAGTITFAPGVTIQTVHVGILGDTAVEPSETFTVTLSAPSGVTIAKGTAVGTITNDDVAVVVTPPTVSVADSSVTEGGSGTSNLVFTATLSKVSATTVTVRYATSNGTATAGQDYTAGSGTLTFAPGVISQTVTVAVTGDATVEPTETFTVTLSSPSGATIARATAIGTILTDDITPQTGATTAQWGNAFFAPYVDMAGWPVPDLVAMSKATGASLFTLGFLQVDPAGNPAWGGYGVLEPNSTDAQAVAINKSIAALRAAGGDVMISFGGAAGTSLAQSYVARGLSAQALANAYAGVVDTYSLTHLDFDIEGAAVADAASIALNSSALKLLQQARPQVQIWYTLPVLPQGLTIDGLNVVQSALTAGVKLAGVNVMAMDYGDGPAPTSGPNAQTMGTYAIQSAQSTYNQLSSLYAKNGQTFAWKQIGVTPMIGVNDITSEVFTVADAQALQAFAVSKGLGMLSLWSVERDYPGTLGQPTHNASGVSSPAGSFSGAFNKYGTINVLNYTGGTVTPTPTPVTPGLSISDASASEPGSGGIAAGFLRTSGNQIIDSQGKTVQISGVNWFGMESTTQAPHGLWT
ncbi:Calx-beta domain-containing protein, partial [Mycolicibacterium sp.]|uniref:Calx-beta domain-containing protein n=1 Tax=Mycolicibacterium sp. TaxID=2320850 RepID=UPI0025D1E149